MEEKVVYNIVSMCNKSFQSGPTLCDPRNCSPPGSSVHGIFQARTLEWVSISSSMGLPDPGIEPESPASPAFQADSLPTETQGKRSLRKILKLLKI